MQDYVGQYTLQPHEEYPIAIQYAQELTKLGGGAVLSSGDVYASNLSTTTTTLAAAAEAGATTILVVKHVGAGARLILGPGAQEETHKAHEVTGSGPYTVTLIKPLERDHDAGESLTYEPGVSSIVLVNGLATIISPQARALVRGSTLLKRVRVSFLVTTSTGAKWEDDVLVQMRD